MTGAERVDAGPLRLPSIRIGPSDAIGDRESLTGRLMGGCRPNLARTDLLL